MQQIAVRGVQFNQLCACSLGATSGGGKSFYDGSDLSHGESLRNLVAICKGQRAGCENRRPSSFGWSDGLAAVPRLVGACLSAGVRQLNTRDRALFGNK